MEKVTYNKNELLFLFWDLYMLEYNQSLLREIRNANRISAKEINEHMKLNNLFLLRRLRDPGFYLFLLDKINDDQSLVDNVVNYFKKHFLKEKHDIFSTPKSKKIKQGLLEPSEFAQINKLKRNIEKSNEYLKELYKLKLVYLERRMEKARDSFNIDELKVLEHYYNELTDFSYQAEILFRPPDFYEPNQDIGPLIYKSKKFEIENINFFSLYRGSIKISPLNQINSIFMIKFVETVVEKLNLTDEFQDSNLRRFKEIQLQFSVDIVAITSFAWFIEKTKEEKIRILNTLYDLNMILPGALEKVAFEEEDFYIFYKISLYLYKQKHILESLQINNFLINKTLERTKKGMLYNNIGCIYRDFNDYDKALENFSEANKQRNNINSYEYILSLRDIGEAYLKLGETEKGNDYLELAYSEKNILSQSEQIKILGNIAFSYRRIYNFKKEQSILNDIYEYDTLSTNMVIEFEKRFQELDENFNYKQGMNEKYLKRIEEEKQFKILRRTTSKYIDGFQFKTALKIVDNHLKFDKNLEVEMNKVLILIRSSMLDEARKMLENLVLSVNPEEIHSQYIYLYLGIVYFNSSKKDEAKVFFNKYIKTSRKSGVFENEIWNLLFLKSIEFVQNIDDNFLSTLVEDNCVETILWEVYTDLGLLVSKFGLFELAISLFQLSEKTAQNNKDSAVSLNNIGSIYSDTGNYTEAIKNYEKAIILDNQNYICYNNMCLAFFFLRDFKSASIYAEQALDICPDKLKEFYKMNFDYFRLIAQNRISIGKITDEAVLKIIQSTEYLILDFEKKFQTKSKIKIEDFSTILIGYSKAIEILLLNKIIQPIYALLVEEFGTRIEEKYWQGNKEIKRLDRGLRKVFTKSAIETIEIGSWYVMLKKMRGTNNPVELRFWEFLKLRFKDEEIEEMKSICKFIRDFRNPFAHSEIRNIEQILELRKNIIPQINRLMSIIYNLDDI